MTYTDSSSESALKTGLDATTARHIAAAAYEPSTKLVGTTDKTAPPVISPSGQVVFSFDHLYGTTNSNNGTVNATTSASTDGTNSTPADANKSTIDAKGIATIAAVNPRVQPPTLPEGAGDITAKIDPSGVDQSHNVGDCYFLASLASLANSPNGQQTIRNMIATNGDGSYTVTFPGDPSHPINVTQKDLADNFQNRNVTNSSQWANVIESAFVKYDNIGPDGTGVLGIQGEEIPYAGTTTFAPQAMQLLTGQNVAIDSLAPLNVDNLLATVGDTSSQNVANNIQTALKNGSVITAEAIDDKLGIALGEHSSGDLPGDHVYSVTNYDANTGTISLRNPWGNLDGIDLKALQNDGITPKDDGTIEMSFATFTKYFNSVNISGVNPVGNDVTNTAMDVTRRDNLIPGTVGSLTIDALSGNFSAMPQDASALTNAAMQTVSDLAYDTTDVNERLFESWLFPTLAPLRAPAIAAADAAGINSDSFSTFTGDMSNAASNFTTQAQNFAS